MDLNVMLEKSNFYYSLGWRRANFDPLAAKSPWIQQGQRLEKLALPFLALYRPAAPLISHGLNLWNIYQSSIQLLNDPSHRQQAAIEIAKSVAEIAITCFNLRLGLMVRCAMELCQNAYHLYLNPDQRDLKALAENSSTAIYLVALARHASLGWALSSLLFQACLNFYSSYLAAALAAREIRPVGRDLRQDQMLDAVASSVMGALRLYQAYQRGFKWQGAPFNPALASSSASKACAKAVTQNGGIARYTALAGTALQYTSYAAILSLFFKYSSYINTAAVYGKKVLDMMVTPSVVRAEKVAQALEEQNRTLEESTSKLEPITDRLANLEQKVTQMTASLEEENHTLEEAITLREQQAQIHEEVLKETSQKIEKCTQALQKLISHPPRTAMDEIYAQLAKEAEEDLQKATRALSERRDALRRKIDQTLPAILKQCQELNLVEKKLNRFYMLKMLVETIERNLQDSLKTPQSLAMDGDQNEEKLSKLNLAIGSIQAYNNELSEGEEELEGFITELEQMMQDCRPA